MHVPDWFTSLVLYFQKVAGWFAQLSGKRKMFGVLEVWSHWPSGPSGPLGPTARVGQQSASTLEYSGRIFI